MPQVVVPILAPILVSSGVSGITALSVSIAVGNAIVSAGTSLLLSVGLSAAAAAIQRSSYGDRGALARGINEPEIRLNTRQEVPAQRWVYGEVLIGGPLFFEESVGNKYYQGFLWSEGPITEVIEIRNTQELLPLQNIQFGTIMQPFTNLDGAPPYVGKCRMCVRRGTIDQTIDPILSGAFSTLDPVTFRQRGVAALVFEASFGTDYEQNELMWGTSRRPNPIALIRGVPVYDPRDPAQRLPNDPDDREDLEDARLTWKWSNNASLVQADYLWRPNGGRIDLGKMRWDKIADSADYDDQLIPTASGQLIRRHTVDGVVTAGQQPVQIIQSMLTANRGFVARSRGDVWIQSSRPVDTPILTITDDDLMGGIEIRRNQPKRNLVNRVRSRFIDPRQQWTTVDGPIRDRTDLRTTDGDLYEATIDLPWTADHRRAQRLQKLYLDETRLGRNARFMVNMQRFGLEVGHVIRLQLKCMPKANGIYRINETGLADGFTSVVVTATEYNAEIEKSWTAADEMPFELPDLELA